jgi:hypothetical protein
MNDFAIFALNSGPLAAPSRPREHIRLVESSPAGSIDS